MPGMATSLPPSADAAATPQAHPDNVWAIIDALLAAPDAACDPAIDTALAWMGAQSGADMVCLYQLDGVIALRNTHAWRAPGLGGGDSMLQGALMAPGDACWTRIGEQGALAIPDVTALPEADDLRHALMARDIQALIALPLGGKGALSGVVGCAVVQGSHRRLSVDAMDALGTVANAIGAALQRRHASHAVRRARMALAIDRGRLQAMMTVLPDLVLEADPDGVFTGFHQTGSEAMLSAPEELVGKSPEAVLPAHLAALMRRMMADVDRTGHSGPEEYAFWLPSQERWFTAFATARRVTDPDPDTAAEGAATAPHGYVFVVRNITHEIDQRRQIEQLSALGRLTSNLVMITDADTRITWINPACEARTGYTLAEARGRFPDEILNLDAAAPDQRSALLSALSAGSTVHTELTAQDRAGQRFELSAHARRMVSDIDGAESVILVAVDVSDRRRSELAQKVATAEAEASRLQLENAVNALEDAFYYMDRDQRLVLCNAALRALYPNTGALMVPGVHLRALIAAARRNGELLSPPPGGTADSHPLLARFDTPHYLNELKLRDGRWLRVIEKATPDGGRVGMFFDISALKAAEARAKRDRATALDASREGIAIVNASGRVTYANSAMKTMFALPDSALLEGRRWTRLYPREVTAKLRATALPALESDGFWRGELTLPGDGGTVHQLSITRDSDGSAVWILRDVSETRRAGLEQQRLREELQLAQRREVIAQLATELAHDFNNLLSAISGSAGLITRLDPPPEFRTHAARIGMASDQAAGLVQRLMTLGERRANLREIDLRDTVRDAAQLLRATLNDESLLRMDLPAAPLRARADPTDVLQVILNLLLNARDAIDSGRDTATGPSKIHLHLRRAQGADLARSFVTGRPDPSRAYFCLTLRDNGPGMSDAVRAQAFDRSFTTKGPGGAGLGLRIVANVVTGNHGCIALDTAPGKGCAVTVLWPLEQPAHAPAWSTPPAQPGPSVTGARPLSGRAVLVVDDNDAVLSVLCRDLESAGAEVVGCACPHDALDAVRDAPQEFDLVVSDERMPGMSGTALSLHLHHLAPHAPVIVVSGAPAEPHAIDSPPPNIVARLVKPVRCDALVAAAAAALGDATGPATTADGDGDARPAG